MKFVLFIFLTSCWIPYEDAVFFSDIEPSAEFDSAKAYEKVCQACHGADGKGNGWAANFAETNILKKKDSDLIANVINGYGNMPSQRMHYNEQEVLNILNYLRKKYN